jgi:ElaB/YqjD/DUF883 family membrane-anchored ribosome-binding protein
MPEGPMAERDVRELEARLARLDERQEALIGGVSLMNDTLCVLSAMLEQVLKAAAQPSSEGGGLDDALHRIADLLADQNAALEDLQRQFVELPDRIATAVSAAR